MVLLVDSVNNSNRQDDIYGAIVMTQLWREFRQFTFDQSDGLCFFFPRPCLVVTYLLQHEGTSLIETIAMGKLTCMPQSPGSCTLLCWPNCHELY